MFYLLSVPLDTACLDGLFFSDEVPSVFASPVDSYTALYLECSLFSTAVNFMALVNYPESSVSLVPMDSREQLLTFNLKQTLWVRLKDGSVGYVLDHEDHDQLQRMELVAVPPLLPPLNFPAGRKQRRLYTYADLQPLLANLAVPRLSAIDKGTHVMRLKTQEVIEFMGPLLISSIPRSKLKPIDHPDPFELQLFFEAKDAWSTLLDSLRHHPGLNTDQVDGVMDCCFLTPEDMVKLAQDHAALRLANGDHITIVRKGTELGGLEGEVCSVAGDEVTVKIFVSEQVATFRRKDLRQIFLPLSLVEVVSGRHQGVRGLVLYQDGDSFNVLDENNTSNIDEHRQTRPLDNTLPLHDISRRFQTFTSSERILVQRGQHQGCTGTILWTNWDSSYQVCKAVVPDGYLADWISRNRYWVPSMPYNSGKPPTWKPNDLSQVMTIFPEEATYLDPSKTFNKQVGRDFLVGKRVLVQGAHDFKGLKGLVTSVDITQGIAQVSIDAKTVTTNQRHFIDLRNLALDVSNSRSDIYLQLGINTSRTYVEPTQLPVVIPRAQTGRPPTPPPPVSTSTDSPWAPDALDAAPTAWHVEPPVLNGASWLLEPEAYNQLNGRISFRVGIRRGKGGRTTGWTCPISQKPAGLPDLKPDEVLVDVMAKKKHFVNVFQAKDLVTIHLTKADLVANVWLLTPQEGHRFGALIAFDTGRMLTEDDEKQYRRGSHVAVEKFKQAMCTVMVVDGQITIRNDNLVKFTVSK
ncbi:hypothetical protein QCA50_014654 [Cerrena zonata]|uniref:KOW domain-containing protein n=1 Tax=Cerrena zonata TaxID=2478898 RepID=A0AAW0FW39_9APHY